MNRHPFRWGSAVFGLLFAGIAASWTVLELDVLDVEATGVGIATILVLLGVLGILGTAAMSRPGRGTPAVPDRAPAHDDATTAAVDESVETEPVTTAPHDLEEDPDGREEPSPKR